MAVLDEAVARAKLTGVRCAIAALAASDPVLHAELVEAMASAVSHWRAPNSRWRWRVVVDGSGSHLAAAQLRGLLDEIEERQDETLRDSTADVSLPPMLAVVKTQ